ncbi:MAG TPA: TetR/AcrR family transcriptional regulator [Micromonosporaceae bacterium]
MSGVKNSRPRRPYQSPLREDSARRTRQAIVAAAGDLFVTRGYVGASLAQVATVAGVARPTVFAAFGSKAALLKEVLDQALAGDDEPVPVAERPWFAPVWHATAPIAVLDAYAEVCVLIGSRAARLFETVRRAADDSAEAAALWETLQNNRRIGASTIISRIETLGPLADDLDSDTATDILWTFNDPAQYAALVLQRGWPEARFRRWLAATMCRALLPG